MFRAFGEKAWDFTGNAPDFCQEAADFLQMSAAFGRMFATVREGFGSIGAMSRTLRAGCGGFCKGFPNAARCPV